MRVVKRLSPALFPGKPAGISSCPTCGTRVYRLIVWSLLLFFITVFYSAKLLSPLLKEPPASEDKELAVVTSPAAMAGDPLRLHMGKQDVLRAWGTPERVVISQDVENFRRETWFLSGGRKVTFGMIGTVESFEQPGPPSALMR